MILIVIQVQSRVYADLTRVVFHTPCGHRLEKSGLRFLRIKIYKPYNIFFFINHLYFKPCYLIQLLNDVNETKNYLKVIKIVLKIIYFYK